MTVHVVDPRRPLRPDSVQFLAGPSAFMANTSTSRSRFGPIAALTIPSFSISSIMRAARRRLAAREDARRFGAWVDTLEPADGPVRARWAASREAVLPPRPLLRGHDLMALGLVAGPELKVWLERVDDAVLMRELTTAEAAQAWVQAQLRAPHMPVT